MTHPLRRPYVPRLERLEDRTVPSTLTVINNLDSGPGSLRATLAAANNGDTITFAPSLSGQTIALTSGPLTIPGQVTIIGPGAASLAIDGNNNTILHLQPAASASVSGLTFTNGNGAIDNAGTLTLTNDTFTANHGVGILGGGAIANSGILTLSHDTFTGNTATAATGANVFGGALWNKGQAAIDHCTFQNNGAFEGGGTAGDYFDGSFGGAIANSGGKLTITASTFSNNEAISAAGATRAGGGAIDNDNTGRATNDAGNPDISTASITDCTFNGNLALGGSQERTFPGGLAEGGAIANQGEWASMTVNACMLTNNQAAGGVGGSYGSVVTPPAGIGVFGEGAGGGIANLDSAVLSVDNSQLTGNGAVGGDSRSGSDAMPGQGGGIFNASAVLTVADTALSSNEAAGGNNTSLGPTGDAPGGNATGGAIENLTGATGAPGNLTLLNCTLITNSAVAGQGGASNFGPGGPDGVAYGGAIDDAGGTASVAGCTLDGNRAIGSAGGVGNNGGQAMGGGIMVASSLTLSASTLIGNTVAGGAGGQPFFTAVGNGGNGLGGGVAVAAGGTATIASTQITGNFARGGAAGDGGFVGWGIMGGISAGMFGWGGGMLTLDSTIDPMALITSNHQTAPPPPLATPVPIIVTNTLDGGPGSLRDAIASASVSGYPITFAPGLSGKTITLTSGPLTISGDITITGPGAANLMIDGHNHQILQVAQGADVAIDGITFTHGLAHTGGAINNAGTLLLSNDIFTANQAAGGQGGGAIDNSGSLTLNHDLFNANRATAAPGNGVSGGALRNIGQVQIANCTFQNNQAVNSGGIAGIPTYSGGGAIANTAGDIVVSSSTFTNNEAVRTGGNGSAGGGAIDNDSTAAIDDCSFRGNQALCATGDAQGGALINQGSGAVLTLNGSMLTNNRAFGGGSADANAYGQAAGGGLANLGGALATVDSDQLSGNQAVGSPTNIPVPTWQMTLPPPGTGAGFGGGIFNGGAGLMVLDTTLANNRAQGGNNSAGLGSSAAGGGIENGGAGAGSPSGYLDVAGTTLMNNVALAGRGGTQATGLTNGFAAGGGIDDSNAGSDTVLSCSFIGNQAIGAAGGSGQDGGRAMGGAIDVFDGGSSDGSLVLSASSLLGNQAIGGAAGTAATSVPPTGRTATGGGIALTSYGPPGVTVTITGTQITGNFARAGAGPAGVGIGGGTYNIASISLDPTTVVTNNHASTSNNDIYP